MSKNWFVFSRNIKKSIRREAWSLRYQYSKSENSSWTFHLKRLGYGYCGIKKQNMLSY